MQMCVREDVFCACTGSNLSREGQAVLMSLCTSARHPAETVIQSRCVVLYTQSFIHQRLLSGRLEMYNCVCVSVRQDICLFKMYLKTKICDSES